MAKYRALFAFFAFVFIAGLFTAKLRPQSRRSRSEGAVSASFDYYVLSLSWAPEFCAQVNAAAGNPQECAPGAHAGFIVHGLWPEAATGRSPESCGGKTKPKPVPKSVVNVVLRDMLSPGLIQHEWETHGACSGLNPFDYFSAIVQVRAAVQIPVQITSIEDETRESPGQIETQFAEANPTFPRTAFRTACPRGELQEERICFDKNLKPRVCGSSLSECNIEAVRIRPRS
jgi:ribonuclease T2